MVFENTHEAIVSQEMFDLVHELRKTPRRINCAAVILYGAEVRETWRSVLCWMTPQIPITKRTENRQEDLAFFLPVNCL